MKRINTRLHDVISLMISLILGFTLVFGYVALTAILD